MRRSWYSHPHASTATTQSRQYKGACNDPRSVPTQTPFSSVISAVNTQMSTSLATRTTLGLIPLAIGILLRHYYDKVLKDKNKGKNGDGPVPLRLEELMYDEAFTLTRVSSLHSSSCLSQPQSIQSTELYGFGNEVRLFLTLCYSLNLAVNVAIPSRNFSNLRICTHPRGLHLTSCASLFRSHAAQRPRACSCAPLVVKPRRGAWSVAYAGGKYVPGTAGESLFPFLLVRALRGARVYQSRRGMGHG